MATKKQYRALNKANYANKNDEMIQIQIDESKLLVNNDQVELNIKTTEITDVFETKSHFFLTLIDSEQAFIVPTKEIDNELQDFRKELLSLGKTIHDESQWKW